MPHAPSVSWSIQRLKTFLSAIDKIGLGSIRVNSRRPFLDARIEMDLNTLVRQ